MHTTFTIRLMWHQVSGVLEGLFARGENIRCWGTITYGEWTITLETESVQEEDGLSGYLDYLHRLGKISSYRTTDPAIPPYRIPD